MLVRLHSQATTTPKIRAAIKASIEPAWKVGERYGISEQTVLKWRHRDNVEDRVELMRWMPPPNGINCAKMVLL